MDLLGDLSIRKAAIPSQIPAKYTRRTNLQVNRAQPYDERVYPIGWYMMEKYDGIRVTWDGTRLLSTWNNQNIDLPTGITFPSNTFEGELW
jgi:hypothetical protein